VRQAASEGVKVQAMGGCQHPAPTQQDLEGLGGGKAGADLASHGRGRCLALRQAHSAGVHQVAAVQARRRQPDGKAKGLLVVWQIAPLEIVVETHAARHEVQHGGTHADWRCCDGRNAPAMTGCKHGPPCVKGKEVQAVDIEVHIGQKLVKVVVRNPLGKWTNVQLWVDVCCLVSHHLNLWQSQG
jgi:hypothetical protein